MNPLLGKRSLEDEIAGQFGMTEEEAAALEIEEAAAAKKKEGITPEEQEKIDAEATRLEEEEAARLEEEEAARLEKERFDGLTEEEQAAEIKEKEDEDDKDKDIVIGGDDDDDDDDTKTKKKEINTQITEEAFFEFASKNLGREVKTFDDLNQQLPAKFDNEQLENISNFVNDTGREPFDWFKMQQLNVGAMDSEQLVKTQLSIKWPTLKSHEIDRKFNRLYKLDPENFTEDEVSDAQLDLKIDAETAKTDLTKLAEGYKVPEKQDRRVNDGVAQREAQRVKTAYVNQMVKDVDSIDSFNFDVGGSKVRYKPSRDDRKQIKNLNQNLETFFDQFRNADGTLNTNELSEGLWKASKGNVEKLLTGALSKGKAEGKGGQIKKQKHIRLPDTDGQKGTQSERAAKEQEDLAAVLNQETRSGNAGMRIKL